MLSLYLMGGDENNPPLNKPVPKKPFLEKPALKKPVPKKFVPNKKPWRSVRVSAGELFLADRNQGGKGIVYHSADGELAFMQVPWKAAL